MRILGIDLGEKRIGISISDELGITAQGLPTINAINEIEDLKNIKEIIDKYGVEKIVLGLPKNMNGSLGKQAQKAISFAEKLKSSFRLPVELEDERLSTSKAEKSLIESDRSRKKRKKVIDKMSAIIILQSFLDRRMMNKEIKK
ncbi:MAG: Holliday junction resolvase RuvX [Candidatus Caldatribacteriota bacterium]|nr:Holliday junction resolvase RuvX [Candidatus Caldatribacteriota bacterium]